VQIEEVYISNMVAETWIQASETTHLRKRTADSHDPRYLDRERAVGFGGDVGFMQDRRAA